MALTTVASILGRAKKILQDETSVRWTEDELLDWLNDAYKQIVLLRPDSHVQVKSVSLVPGTKQTIPSDGVYFVTVHRNGLNRAVRAIPRAILDDQVPDWHAKAPTQDIEHYVFDRSEPTVYYVYPPAASGASVELGYASVPTPHTSTSDTIRLDDRYAPAILDYILYRAYLKDADYAANDQRAANAYQTFLNNLNVGVGSSTNTA